MNRLLDPVPLLLGGLAGALAGAAASYVADGHVDWPLVVALLVATIVTSLAVMIGAGPSRSIGFDQQVHMRPAEWRFRGPAPAPMGPPPAEMVGPPTIRRQPGGGPFDHFDSAAKRVLALAQDEAIRFNHNYIGTEHLLLGLVREGAGVQAQVLTSLGVDLSKIRTAVEFIIGRGDTAGPPSEITLSPRTKKIIELALDEARELGHHDVTPAHLLLGLIREGEGIAAGILQSLGVEFAAVRAKVLELLPRQPPPASSPPTPPPS